MNGADLLIVGGGPAGLTAALDAARSGHQVVLADAADELGGMSSSRTVAGVRVDLGSHRLHPVATPRVEMLLTELLGSDLQRRERHGRLRLGDAWVGFPLRPIDLARSLPPSFAARALGDSALRPIRRLRTTRRSTEAADTFASVVRDGLGPTMLDSFYGPYARKLWGRAPEDLAGDIARRRIAASSPGRLLAKVARAARGTPVTFRYPRLGYGQVVERLVEACVEAGVELRTSTRIVGLDVSGTEPTASFGAVSPAAAAAEVPSERFARIGWSVALTALTGVVSNAPCEPPPVTVTHRAMVLLYLVFDGASITDFDAHYLPGLDELATRVSEPRNYRDGPDPDGVTVLCAEVPCFVGDDRWCADPADLADRVLEDLYRLGVTARRHRETHAEYLPHVYPVIGPTDVDALAAAQNWGHSLPGVTVFGRQGLTVADNLHHVMEMGLAASSRLHPDGRWDGDGWARDLAAFEQHVVED